MRVGALHVTVLIVAEAVVIALLTVLVIGLLRSHAAILQRLHELGSDDANRAPFQTADGVASPRQTGALAADLAGVVPGGGATAIRVRQTGTSTLLAFMSTTCPTCQHFWDQFSAEQSLAALGGLRLVVVTKGTEEESPAAVAALSPAGLPVVMSTEAWDDYAIPGSPYFVMVEGASGVISGEGSASDWPRLLDLMGIADGDATFGNDHDRAERVDQELADAGIRPGDPRLYGEDGLEVNGGL